jgi:hypothetical protein
MTPVLKYVQTTTYSLTPEPLRLPPSIWLTFTYLNKIHGLWRWYRHAELYTHQDNLVKLLAGQVLNAVATDSLLIRVAAQCLLVATRLMQCIEQQQALIRSKDALIDNLQGRYPAPVNVEWTAAKKWSVLTSPSQFHAKVRLQNICNSTKRAFLATAILFKELFLLSMAIMDVIDAFCWSQEVKRVALTESFINIGLWLDKTVKNRDELLKGIEANQAVIERLLKNSPFTFTQLHAAVKNQLAVAGQLDKGLKKLSSIGGKTIVESGRLALLRTRLSIGV